MPRLRSPSPLPSSSRHRIASIALGLLLGVLEGGCLLQNISPEERLRDAVVGYNDETRWNRLDLAQQRVSPATRGEFRLRHYRWGRDIQIADMDILDVQIRGEERDEATSIVQIRWYDQSTMLVSDTIVAQEWERVTGGYILISESVREGNETLLEIPAELLEEAQGEAGEEVDADANEAEIARADSAAG